MLETLSSDDRGTPRDENVRVEALNRIRLQGMV